MVSWAGFWGNANDSYSLLNNRNPIRTQLERIFRRPSMKVINELWLTLDGAVAGDTASATHVRVQGVSDAPIGGARPIETVTDISRVTVAGDITDLNLLMTKSTAPTYPGDLSGNGK